MKKALIIMAAGMGSRFGGLKQLEGFGPNGEPLLEYSAYDAARAGFSSIVFIIRKHMEADFKKIVLPRTEKYIPAQLVFQELDACLPIPVPSSREKPWGTGHAVLVAQEAVAMPFAVINADDFYGAEAFQLMSTFLETHSRETQEGSVVNAALVAYPLAHTLSENGSVSRGVCTCSEDGLLESITEHTHIELKEGLIVSHRKGADDVILPPDTLVSMNFWGFSHNVFTSLETAFYAFLERSSHDPNAEFYLPFAVDHLIGQGIMRPTVLPCNSAWFGVTYPNDAERVRTYLRQVTGPGSDYVF